MRKMNTVLVVIVGILFLTPGLFAQAQTGAQAIDPQKQVETPVSRDDLRAVKDELKATLRESEKRGTEQALQEKQEAEIRQKELLDKANLALSNAKEAQAELARQNAKQQEAVRQEQETTRKYTLIAIGLVAVLLIVIGIWNRNRGTKVQLIATHEKTSEIPKLPVNPTSDQVREFSEKHGNMQKVPFILDLDKTGRFMCLAEVRPKPMDPLVSLGDDPKQTTWEKRKSFAARNVALAIK